MTKREFILHGLLNLEANPEIFEPLLTVNDLEPDEMVLGSLLRMVRNSMLTRSGI